MTPGPDGEPAGRVALLLGATGLVGAHCLDLLLADRAYRSVRVLARRPVERTHPKLDFRRVDFDRLDQEPALFRVDDVFCALGTTIAKAGSQGAFRRVDHDYPVEAARLAAEQGAQQFVLVTALGADPESRIFYNRVKGETEADVRKLPFRAVWILRPSLILGAREDRRPAERLIMALSRPIAPLLVGPLRRYRPVDARAIAATMVRLAKSGGTGGVVESEEI